MKLFVKIKHWQIFLAIVLPHYFGFVKDRLTLLIITTIYFAAFSIWLYSISIIGQRKLSEFNLHQNTNYLILSCSLLPLLYLIIMLNPAINVIWYRIMMWFIGLGFLACWVYAIYFTSKTIKALDKQRVPKFKEYILIILGFIIWPIGIWFIQPKVNKICT